jgi:hypothetical protein
MTYLYAGMGVGLMIPLLALVQMLISISSLDGEMNNAIIEQNDHELKAVQTYRSTLNAKFIRPISNSTPPSCALEFASSSPKTDRISDPNYTKSPQNWIWQGDYPDCVVNIDFPTFNGNPKYLRIELGIDTQDPSGASFNLWNPPVYSDSFSKQVFVKKSCWLQSFLPQGEGCS